MQHIVDACAKIDEYAAVGKERFLYESMVQDAVIRQFEIIGEAAKNISEQLKLAHPSMPWRQMGRMRDKLIRHYFGIQLEVVWSTIEGDLPTLASDMNELLIELALE